MLVINVKDKNSLNNALKEYRRKVRDTQLLKELRRRKQFTKPSVGRRNEILNAKYRNSRADEFQDSLTSYNYKVIYSTF